MEKFLQWIENQSAIEEFAKFKNGILVVLIMYPYETENLIFQKYMKCC